MRFPVIMMMFCHIVSMYSQSADSTKEELYLRSWKEHKEHTLLKYHVPSGSLLAASEGFESNLALFKADKLSMKDVKKDYRTSYRDALSPLIDNYDSIVNHVSHFEINSTTYSNMVYFGLSATGKTGFHPAFDNGITYTGQHGFTASAEMSAWQTFDSINYKSFGIGYSHPGNIFSYELSYQRMMLQYGTLREKNDLKHSLEAGAGLDFSWININLDAAYMAGLNQLFITTGNLEVCKRGNSFLLPFSSWKAGIDLNTYWATDEVAFGKVKSKGNNRVKRNNEKLFDYFGISAYEFSMPLSYTVKKFSVTFSANYAIPVSNAGNPYVLKKETIVKSPNQFYTTLGLNYKIVTRHI